MTTICDSCNPGTRALAGQAGHPVYCARCWGCLARDLRTINGRDNPA